MSDEVATEMASAPDATVTAPTTEIAQPDDASKTNGDALGSTEGKDATLNGVTATAVVAPDGETTEVAEPAPVATTEDTSPSNKKEKRKSGVGVPEHKSKKLQKKKSMPTLHLDCQPGDYYWARLKGYPPWPAIICDEQMLPESLLASRPVSTANPDGQLREDFKEGGKNAKERTYPVMFLSTNEFSWMVNTALTPLQPEECEPPYKSKMVKALVEAYKLAVEQHDITYFKGLLKQWQDDEVAIAEEIRRQQLEDERQQEEDAAEAADAEKKKKKSRKSKGGSGDIEMADVVETPKSSKKRKKGEESDGEGLKQPKKTPKITKINAPKAPSDDGASAKKSSSKQKKRVVAPKPDETEAEQKPVLTAEERLKNREKAVLYLRHRLQKGFLARDAAPKESEMASMADLFVQLESYDQVEPAIIRATKIHKVLKAIVKLSTIPKDEEYHFKKRSSTMLEIWNKRMESEGGTPEVKPAATNGSDETNGDDKDEPTETKEEAADHNETPATNGAEPAAETNPAETEAAADSKAVKVDSAEEDAKPSEANETPGGADTEMTDAKVDSNEAVSAET